MTSLIAGYGEIGKALFNILKEHYKVWAVDLDYCPHSVGCPSQVDILHICFPFYGKGDKVDFIEEVKEYQEKYKPKYTILHSTCPVGTCRQLNSIHSPVVGQHPFLEEGLKTFPKMLGGEQASEVADYFRRVGLKVVLFDDSRTTEAAKLFLTEYYRECIEFAKRVKNYCDKHNLNFHETYTIPNEIYNSGYKKLGYEEFMRPILQPIKGEIKGHCVQPNAELIKLSE